MAALAVIAAVAVWNVTSRASDAAAALGTSTSVWVAVDHIAPGTVIEADAIVLEERPVAFVPDSAVVDDPVGSTARAGVAAGEVLVADRVSENGSGPAALIPSGWRGVAITTFDPPPPLAPGSLVDVVVSLDPALGSGRGGVLVDDATVVHVAETNSTVTVAVPERHVSALATAQMAGAVTLVLAG